MGELVQGDDGIPAEEVGAWAKVKHESLRRYIDISSAVRTQWLGQGKAGATYVDIFCGPGRAKVRRTGEWIDGSCVSAWKQSVASGAPFSSVFIGDADDERRGYAAQRLRALGAPVFEVQGQAAQAAQNIANRLNPYGLHFVFLDPYNLATFNFSVLENFSHLKRMDILVHISKMDLQRNLGLNVTAQQSAFDVFAPGWRDEINMNQPLAAIRRDVMEYWKKKVSGLGIAASTDMELITGSRGQHLYWLALAARHDLAHAFWKIASNKSGQGTLF